MNKYSAAENQATAVTYYEATAITAADINKEAATTTNSTTDNLPRLHIISNHITDTSPSS